MICKKIWAVLLAACVCAVSVAAQETAVAASENKTEWGVIFAAGANLYQGTYTRNADFKSELFKGANFGDSKAWVRAQWRDTLGTYLKFSLPETIASNTVLDVTKVFGDSYAWLRLGKIFYTEMGLIDKRKAALLDSVIDKYKYGNFTAAGGMDETDLLQWMDLEFSIPVPKVPMKIEVAPFNAGIANVSAISIDQNRTSGTNWSNSANMGVRYSLDIMEKANLSFFYKFGYTMKDLRTQGQDESVSPPKIHTLNNYYSVFSDVLIIPYTKLVFGYSGQLKWTSKKAEGKEDSNVLSDVYHTLDLRAEFSGVPHLVLATQHKFTFGHNIGDEYVSEQSMEHKLKKQTMLAYWGAFGFQYKITDRFHVRATVHGKYLRYDEKGANRVVNETVMGFEPEVRYYFWADCYLKAGLTLEVSASDRSLRSGSESMWDDIEIKPSIPLYFSFKLPSPGLIQSVRAVREKKSARTAESDNAVQTVEGPAATAPVADDVVTGGM